MPIDQLTQARERCTFAKQRWTAATQAAQRADPEAAKLAEEALRELNAAQAGLRRLTAAAA